MFMYLQVCASLRNVLDCPGCRLHTCWHQLLRHCDHSFQYCDWNGIENINGIFVCAVCMDLLSLITSMCSDSCLDIYWSVTDDPVLLLARNETSMCDSDQGHCYCHIATSESANQRPELRGCGQWEGRVTLSCSRKLAGVGYEINIGLKNLISRAKTENWKETF